MFRYNLLIIGHFFTELGTHDLRAFELGLVSHHTLLYS